MGDYSGRIDIDRPADDVFGFLSDVRNLPAYLPMVRLALPRGEGKVVVEGATSAGRRFRSEGWLQVDRAARRMSWGMEGTSDYGGDLEVTEEGSRARVEVRIHISPQNVSTRSRLSGEAAGAAMQNGIEEALRAIKGLCDGTGRQRAAEGKSRGVDLRSGGRQARPDDDSLLGDSRTYGSSGTLNPPDVS